MLRLLGAQDGLGLVACEGCPCGRFWPGGLTVILAVLMLSVVDKAVRAQETQPVKVPAKLNCGSHSSDPNQLKSFQTDLQFSVVDSLCIRTERQKMEMRRNFGASVPRWGQCLSPVKASQRADRRGPMNSQVRKIREA